jgi:hypothetical protein
MLFDATADSISFNLGLNYTEIQEIKSSIIPRESYGSETIDI